MGTEPEVASRVSGSLGESEKDITQNLRAIVVEETGLPIADLSGKTYIDGKHIMRILNRIYEDHDIPPISPEREARWMGRGIHLSNLEKYVHTQKERSAEIKADLETVYAETNLIA